MIKKGRLIFILLLSLCLSSCAERCPSVCLGEKLGAIDWKGRNYSGGVFIGSMARQSNLRKIDLSNADLTNVDLKGADLSASNLNNTYFINANLADTTLTEANFDNTDLRNATLSKADLSGARINNSDLSAATLLNTRMVNANLSQLSLPGAVMDGSILSGAVMDRVDLSGGVLEKVDLSGADLRFANLRGIWLNLSQLVGADLYGADLSGASLIGADFSGCDLREASLAGANLYGANFRGADLRGADLSDATVTGSDQILREAFNMTNLFQEMSASQLRDLGLGETVFYGATYDSDTIWPNGLDIPASVVYRQTDGFQNSGMFNNAEEKLARVSGSLTARPLVQTLSEAYTLENPKIFLSVNGNSSTDGIRQVATGAVDVAMSSRPLTAEEAEKYPGLKLTTIARDSIQVVVNLENRVNDISMDELGKIYSGELTNWTLLGGKDLPIQAFFQNDSISYVFTSRVLPGVDLSLVKATSLPSIAAVRATVASTPGAIGFLPQHYVDASVKAVTIDGLAPNKTSIRSDTYPLARPYYLITRGEPNSVVKNWIEFIFSAQGTQIIRSENYEPANE